MFLNYFSCLTPIHFNCIRLQISFTSGSKSGFGIPKLSPSNKWSVDNSYFFMCDHIKIYVKYSLKICLVVYPVCCLRKMSPWHINKICFCGNIFWVLGKRLKAGRHCQHVLDNDLSLVVHLLVSEYFCQIDAIVKSKWNE